MTFRIPLLLSLLGATLALAAPCPVHATWPTTEWPVKLVDVNAKAAQIKALEDYAFTLVGKDADRKGYRTDALVMIKSGAIAWERYGRGFTAENRHIAWSVAKSITSSLAGVAVQQGALSVDDSICKYLTEYSGDVCKITVKHLLTFTSGLGWQELYEKDPYQQSSEIALLFGVGHRDQLRHILSHRIVAAPGDTWLYSSGDAQAASAVIKRALESKTGDKRAFWTYFFDKIGMSNAVFEEDIKGCPQGGGMVYATPRDFAKFGYFSMNDGCWAGERLLPEGWMAMATTVSDAFRDHAKASEETPNGWSWWLNVPIASRNQEKPWKDAPDGAFAALGHWGQKIIVVPSEDVVIVRTGDDRDGSIKDNELIKFALEVVR